VVDVTIEAESHVGLPHTEKQHVFRYVKLTYRVPPTNAETPCSIRLNPEAVRAEAGLTVEHIAPDGSTTKQDPPPADWWLSKVETVENATSLPMSFHIWVMLDATRFDFSQLGLYRISYVHPWADPDPEVDHVRVSSNTLVIACVTQERWDQLRAMLRQDPQLAAASYQFKHPPCVEYPRYYRNESLEVIASRAQQDIGQDEVLLLLGPPDLRGLSTPGEERVYGWDESWLYETSPSASFSVHFKDGRVIATHQHRDGPP
jgi:hypothetical protein